MEINRLFSDKASQPTMDWDTAPSPVEDDSHEAIEVSLCDEGMCFSSKVRLDIGTVLLVDFAPEASDNDHSLQSEAVVVDCRRADDDSTYDITVLFMGN